MTRNGHRYCKVRSLYKRSLSTIQNNAFWLKFIANSPVVWGLCQLIFCCMLWSRLMAMYGHKMIKYDWITPALLCAKDILVEDNLNYVYNDLSVFSLQPKALFAASFSGMLAFYFSFYFSHLILYRLGVSSSPRLIGWAFQPLNYVLASLLGFIFLLICSYISCFIFLYVYLQAHGPFPVPSLLTNSKFDNFIFTFTIFSFWLFRGLSAGFTQPLFRCIAPSEIIHEGSFAHESASIPATSTKYVNEGERILIYKFGQRFGCHHCGITGADVKFHGDHIPVTKHVKTGVRRLIAGKQQFFPQCADCSNQQGGSVARDRRLLRIHRMSSFRLWHVWLPIPLIYILIVKFILSQTNNHTVVNHLFKIFKQLWL